MRQVYSVGPSKALSLDVNCINGTTWHGYASMHRTSNGGHTMYNAKSGTACSW